jgi:hypothetical protein
MWPPPVKDWRTSSRTYSIGWMNVLTPPTRGPPEFEERELDTLGAGPHIHLSAFWLPVSD